MFQNLDSSLGRARGFVGLEAQGRPVGEMQDPGPLPHRVPANFGICFAFIPNCWGGEEFFFFGIDGSLSCLWTEF